MELLTKASFSDEVSDRERRGRDVAYRAACESIVLLKNDGTLPFSDKKVAAFGAGVCHTIKGGTGSGEVNERHSVSILEGLENRGFLVTSRTWLGDFEAEYAEKRAAFDAGRKLKVHIRDIAGSVNEMFSDFQMPVGRSVSALDVAEGDAGNCIYVISRQAGEGGDRKLEKGDYLLTDAEVADIRFCAEQFARLVLVVNCGSPIDLAFAEGIDGIGAILHIGQLGTEGGNAVADVLSGAVVPSGKLADTWARAYSDYPLHDEYSHLDGNLDEARYGEGIYVGYRYFDSFGIEPLYPFGHGLSYADFEIGPAAVAACGTEVTATATVRNAGKRFAGKETVQLYISAPQGTLGKERKRLAAFCKTGLLAPGESEEVTLRFDLAVIASFREKDASFVLETGDYVVHVGSSSRDTEACAALRLPETVVISRHRHVCPVMQALDEKKPHIADESAEGLPVVQVDPAVFVPVTHVYDDPPVYGNETVRRFVEKLTVKEMTDIVVGAGMFGNGNRFKLPGSVGNTTSRFWDAGLVNIALCDGPAGLRIQKVATVDGKGKVKGAELELSALEALPEFVKRRMRGDPGKDTAFYQYATAFPVASALAQTWNAELLYEVGCAVHEEMKEYGCTFWLAPAVNIHRNPLCGRNFEYYSEDPLLCGVLASAVVRGVQQEPGYYATVKHFACNNQEENRNKVDSIVSERALREIYLRAFEICVREGGAKGVMTAYNKVNGVYTPVSHDLCTKVLRNEWGFDGVVMTDWFSTLVDSRNSALALKAGNDLIMPGEPLSKRAIRKAVRKGVIAQKDLRRCCANVVEAIMSSATQQEYMQQKGR